MTEVPCIPHTHLITRMLADQCDTLNHRDIWGIGFHSSQIFPLLLMSPTLSWLPATMKKLPHHLMPLLARSQTYTQLPRSAFIHESPSQQYTRGKPSAAKDPVGRSLQAITLLFPPKLGNTRLGLAALRPPLLILARRSCPRAFVIKETSTLVWGHNWGIGAG